jgi:anti-sigma regulatory factor (Ser/Thr protein kinase)
LAAVPDEITLTLPRQRPFYGIAHLVLGGLALRLELTYEHLEDLQVALEELLEHPIDGDGEVTLRVRVEDGAVRATIGPFPDEVIERALVADEHEMTLGRVLRTVADDVQTVRGDGGAWVELTKARAGS